MLDAYLIRDERNPDMGLFDKAKNLANKNKDKIADGVDKATDAVDEKTGGKHTDHLEKVDDAARNYAGDTANSERATDPPAPPRGPVDTDRT